MKARNSNYTAYSSIAKAGSITKTTNIFNLIEKFKQNEKKEKLEKAYILFGSLGFALILVSFFYFI